MDKARNNVSKHGRPRGMQCWGWAGVEGAFPGCDIKSRATMLEHVGVRFQPRSATSVLQVRIQDFGQGGPAEF